jgi:hypothetical protein
MIIAREKKKNNIAEYILYMWQIEDMIRANDFDLEKIKKNIIEKFDQPEAVRNEMAEWYEDLINRMEKEDIKEKGHLGFLNETIQELENLHEQLIKDTNELDYIADYNKAKSNINDLKTKSRGTTGDIETALQGLYGYLMLKLKGKTINPTTHDAMSSIGILISHLSYKYKKIKQ